MPMTDDTHPTQDQSLYINTEDINMNGSLTTHGLDHPNKPYNISRVIPSSIKAKKTKPERVGLRKAPGAPKRFKSSYILFFMAKQKEIKKELGERASVSPFFIQILLLRTRRFFWITVEMQSWLIFRIIQLQHEYFIFCTTHELTHLHIRFVCNVQSFDSRLVKFQRGHRKNGRVYRRKNEPFGMRRLKKIKNDITLKRRNILDHGKCLGNVPRR